MLKPAVRTFPISASGFAADATVPTGDLTVTDLTARPRFGIKGPGSARWLEGRGLSLPSVNRIATQGGIRLLRLGNEDFLAVGDASDDSVIDLTAAWNAATGARGYWSWREEVWSWMRLSGPLTEAAMARLSSLDLRSGRFGKDEIAQTRVAHLDAVLARSEKGFDVFFDIASTAFFIRTVTSTAKLSAYDPIIQEKH